jgi:hypothetical protein
MESPKPIINVLANLVSLADNLTNKKMTGDPKYQQEAALTNTAIDPNALDPISAFFEHFKYRLSECITHSNLGAYDTNSVTIRLFPTLTESLDALGSPAPEAAASKRPAAADTASRPDSHSSKKPKATTDGQANSSTTNPGGDHIAKPKASGMFKLVNPGVPMPMPRAILYRRKRICMSFVTQGFV